MIEIHPCPFCGYDDIEIDEVDTGRFAVCCPECQCIGPINDKDTDGAIAQWNARKSRLDVPIRFTPDPALKAYQESRHD